jgi:ABC-type polysaccharide/polyol phosphate export permease
MKVYKMNPLQTILLVELKPFWKKAGVELLVNILTTVILYIGFVIGLGCLIPQIQTMPFRVWIFQGIIGFYAIIITFNLSLLETSKLSDKQGLLDQIYSTPLVAYQVYLVKSFGYLIQGIAYLIVSSLVLFLLAGKNIQFSWLILFWLYYAIGLIFVAQTGIIAGITLTKIKLRQGIILMLLIAILFCTGTIVPSTVFPGILNPIVKFFPTNVLIEGGRELLVFHKLSGIFGLYIVLLDSVLFGIGYFIFRRWLTN